MTMRHRRGGLRSSSTPMGTANAMRAGRGSRIRPDPTKDKQIMGAPYGINTSPDGSIYGSILGFPGGVLRFDPKTQLTEYYEVPYKNAKTTMSGFSPRGMGITSEWRGLARARKRPCGELRSQAVQGSAQGADLRQTLRMSVRKAGISIRCRDRSSRILPQGTVGGHRRSALRDVVDSRHAGLRQEHPDRNGQPVRRVEALVDGKWIVMRIPIR